MAPSAPVLIEREDSTGRGKWDLTADLTMSLGQPENPALTLAHDRLSGQGYFLPRATGLEKEIAD
jgi:hypothetical protein